MLKIKLWPDDLVNHAHDLVYRADDLANCGDDLANRAEFFYRAHYLINRADENRADDLVNHVDDLAKRANNLVIWDDNVVSRGNDLPNRADGLPDRPCCIFQLAVAKSVSRTSSDDVEEKFGSGIRIGTDWRPRPRAIICPEEIIWLEVSGF